MQQDKEISKNWLRVDPFDTPVLKDAPKHQPERFSQYIDLKDENDNVIGFQVDEQQYSFDEDGGWTDETGCHYDKDGQPAGWYVLHPGNPYHQHFYDQDGIYEPSDNENSEDVQQKAKVEQS